jgi:hypothetical protein
MRLTGSENVSSSQWVANRDTLTTNTFILAAAFTELVLQD